MFDTDAAVRLASAQKLQSQVTPEMAPLLARALEKETDAQIKALLVLAHAQANLACATAQTLSLTNVSSGRYDTGTASGVQSASLPPIVRQRR